MSPGRLMVSVVGVVDTLLGARINVLALCGWELIL
jgi:hypothetical protein